MVMWKDFILDDFLGPILSPDLFPEGEKKCRSDAGYRAGVMDDAKRNVPIQETRQNEPARMVGDTSLFQSGASDHRDVDGIGPRTLRLRGAE